MDLIIAWRNIWRNPRRTALTMGAIAFACLLLIFMLSFQLGSYGTMIRAAVRVQTGHLQVQAQGYRLDPDIRKVVADPEEILRLLKTQPQVQAVTSRASGVALISSHNRTYGSLVTGIDPVGEKSVSSLAELIREGDYLSSGDTDKALIGYLLARNLGVDIGDELTIIGQGRDGSVAAAVLTVKGIYRSGQDAFDRGAIHIPLDYFQQVFTMGKAVHQIVAIVHDLGEVAGAKKTTLQAVRAMPEGNSLTVVDWKEMMPGLMQGIKLDLVSGLIFYLILILVVAFSIMNTFLMAIMERTREFGVLMALGTRPARLTRLVWMESAMLTAMGVIAGTVLGVVVTAYFQRFGIDFSEASEMLAQYGISGTMYPALSAISITVGPLAVLVITFVAAMVPTWRIRRLKPVEALTHV